MKKSIDSILKNNKIKLLSKEYMASVVANDESMTYYFEYSSGYIYSD